MDYDYVCKTVHNLLDFVTPGGVILLYSSPWFTCIDKEVFGAVSKAVSKYVSCRAAKYKNTSFCVMKKL